MKFFRSLYKYIEKMGKEIKVEILLSGKLKGIRQWACPIKHQSETLKVVFNTNLNARMRKFEE